MKTLYRAGTVVILAALAAGLCLEEDSIEPCECSDIEEGISVLCKGPGDAERIPAVVESLKDTDNLELVLESLTLRATPSTFHHVSALHLHNVRVEKSKVNSSFAWPKLTEVIIESSSIGDKSVPNFKEAVLLNHFQISKIEIPTIGFEFRENVPATLTYLGIRKTKTTVLKPQCLSHLKNLQYIIIVDLPLQEFPRDTLPILMPSLHTFILGNTKIEKLEADFFDGMPKLEVLMLNGNKLTTLDFNLFAPVENQLTHLLAERNPLVCNCNLLWLTHNSQKKGTMKVLATCRDEETAKRKEVTLLNEIEYCP